MTVLSVAYPLFPVGPDASGGAEQILYLLDREIVRSGERSVVLAAGGSSVSGELISTAAPEGALTDAVRAEAQLQHRAAIEHILQNRRVDVIHFHGLDFDTYLPDTDVPMIVTLHLPLAWYPEAALHQNRAKLVCVSESQATGTDFPVVLNGIDTSRFQPAPKQDLLLWLGRICPEKGVHLALEAAHEADASLLIAGPVHAFESHQSYFHNSVEPLLDGKRCYIGPVDGLNKTRLLAEARGVLIPSLAAETSSLVAMEAISSGTPVIAFSSGALPEVVDHDTTGFIVDSPAGMAGAIPKLAEISPEACRAVAEARFEAKRMACDYFRLYR